MKVHFTDNALNQLSVISDYVVLNFTGEWEIFHQ